MKKRNKKYFKEKEYLRLKKKLRENWDAQRNLRWVFNEILQQEEAELESKLLHNFYEEEMKFKNAPKHFRKTLNRSQRYKSKKTLHNIIYNKKDVEFVDNYRGADWLWS